MVKDKIIAYDFKKLRLEDFPISCSYISSQKDFEKVSHTATVDGRIYINTRVDGWQEIFELSKELANATRYNLDKVFRLKKNSKLEQDVLACKLIKLEKDRRDIEHKYYLAK